MKGKISISRICTNEIGRNNNVVLRIEDDKGFTHFDVELTPEKLGLALTGLTFQDCEITQYGKSSED